MADEVAAGPPARAVVGKRKRTSAGDAPAEGAVGAGKKAKKPKKGSSAPRRQASGSGGKPSGGSRADGGRESAELKGKRDGTPKGKKGRISDGARGHSGGKDLKKRKRAAGSAEGSKKLALESPKKRMKTGKKVKSMLTSAEKKEAKRNAVLLKADKLRKVELAPIGGSVARQAEWFSKTYFDHFGAKLSALERDPLTEINMLPLNEGESAGLLSLPDTISSALKGELRARRHSENDAEIGSPLVLAACSSAMRCTELLRVLKPVSKKQVTVKLFAKHIKYEEQVEMLKQPVLFAAGTPARIERLASNGPLGLSALKLLVLDLSLNAKGFSILDIPETKADFWNLYEKHLHQRVLDGQVQICLVD